MASVVKRRRKDGSASWYARYRDGAGKDVWEKCTSAREARARAAEVEVLLARSTNAWTRPCRTTVAEYAELWLAQARDRSPAPYPCELPPNVRSRPPPGFWTNPARSPHQVTAKGVRVRARSGRRVRKHCPQCARSATSNVE